MGEPIQCVILAGGLATRMGALAAVTPKHLLPVGGRPFADHQLDWLSRGGISEVVYCIGHMGELIERHVGDGARWGLRVRYVRDGDKLMGTGGAIRRAFDAGLLANWFFVLYGDSFLRVDLRAFARAFLDCGRPGMMGVYRNRQRYDRGNVLFENGRVALYRKNAPPDVLARMEWIDCGVSALRNEAVRDGVPRGEERDLSDVFERLSLSGGLAGFETLERFYEIGSPEGLADLEAWLEGEEGRAWARR